MSIPTGILEKPNHLTSVVVTVYKGKYPNWQLEDLEISYSTNEDLRRLTEYRTTYAAQIINSPRSQRASRHAWQ